MSIQKKLEQTLSIESQVTDYQSVRSEGSLTSSQQGAGESTVMQQEQEMERQQKLEQDLEKTIKIKDLDTGQEYMLGFQSSAEQGQVTDLKTGQELEFGEFEEKLGLAAQLQLPKIMDDSFRTESSKQALSRTSNKKVRDKRAGSHGSSNSMMEVGYKAKVNVNRKLVSELTGVMLIQSIQAHQGHIWAIKFSVNNQYLATGGADSTVKLWHVIGSEDSDILIKSEPYRVWHGHQREIMDLSWSKSQFLLSASMDKTVRLWHVKMDEQLRVFKHNDYVTSVNFHPKDDTMFISGSIDQKVRIWNIPDQKVMDWQSVHEIITATQVASDGREIVVGTIKGNCVKYTCDKARLEYKAKIEVKNAGQFSKGHKITGIEFLPNSNNKILVTTNDSRIRMYEDYQEIQKFKGHTNLQTQIRSHFSRDGNFVISGSDDGGVYVWTTENTYLPDTGNSQSSKKEKLCSYESFQAHEGIVTVACFGPRLLTKKDGQQSIIVSIPGEPSGLPEMSKTVSSLLRGKDSFLGGSRYNEAQQQAIESSLQKRINAAYAKGMIIVTAGTNGDIKVWENRGNPEWLQ